MMERAVFCTWRVELDENETDRKYHLEREGGAWRPTQLSPNWS